MDTFGFGLGIAAIALTWVGAIVMAYPFWKGGEEKRLLDAIDVARLQYNQMNARTNPLFESFFRQRQFTRAGILLISVGTALQATQVLRLAF